MHGTGSNTQRKWPPTKNGTEKRIETSGRRPKGATGKGIERRAKSATRKGIQTVWRRPISATGKDIEPAWRRPKGATGKGIQPAWQKPKSAAMKSVRNGTKSMWRTIKKENSREIERIRTFETDHFTHGLFEIAFGAHTCDDVCQSIL